MTGQNSEVLCITASVVLPHSMVRCRAPARKNSIMQSAAGGSSPRYLLHTHVYTQTYCTRTHTHQTFLTGKGLCRTGPACVHPAPHGVAVIARPCMLTGGQHRHTRA